MTIFDLALTGSIILNLILLAGILIYILRLRYDGALEISDHPDGTKSYLLNLDTDLDEIGNQKQIILKVNPLS